MRTPAQSHTANARPEAHAVVLWHRALPQADRIIDDLRSRVAVVDAVRVTWAPERFAQNLTRFYGQTLPPGSDKERECGIGPFLVLIAVDPTPTYAFRRTTRGRVLVHAGLHDAKRRYRRWTGGGHKVHATLTAAEGAKDLLLLLGLRVADIVSSRAWDGTFRERRADLLGFDGWESPAELVDAVAATVSAEVIEPAPGESLRLRVDDVWWAVRIADPGAEDDEPVRVVRVAGAPFTVRLTPSVALDAGDGEGRQAAARRLLARLRRPAHG